jgi:hypothetical protein
VVSEEEERERENVMGKRRRKSEREREMGVVFEVSWAPEVAMVTSPQPPDSPLPPFSLYHLAFSHLHYDPLLIILNILALILSTEHA